MPDISVIIVNYNTKDLTLGCINSILINTKGLEYEIVVVDNGSDDGLKEALRKLSRSKENIIFIRNNSNLGYAKANNQGIKKAKGRYIFLLNSDTLVMKDSIKTLFEYLRSHPEVGAVGPRLLNEDKSIQPSVYRFPSLIKAIRQYWLGEKDLMNKYIPSLSEPVEVDIIVMAACMISPSAIKEVGLLDEKYFMYFEDFDYCRRMKRKNLKVVYLPNSQVIHYHGKSGEELVDKSKQWKRLIPSSKIYYGLINHLLINSVIWLGGKFNINEKE